MVVAKCGLFSKPLEISSWQVLQVSAPTYRAGSVGRAYLVWLAPLVSFVPFLSPERAKGVAKATTSSSEIVPKEGFCQHLDSMGPRGTRPLRIAGYSKRGCEDHERPLDRAILAWRRDSRQHRLETSKGNLLELPDEAAPNGRYFPPKP